MRNESVELGWFIPTTGDGKFLGVPSEREPTGDYVVRVAQAAENAGYEFVLIPTGGACLDAWVVGSWIASQTTTLKTLVAMRPGVMNPVLAAQMGSTLDQISQGRVKINIVTGHYSEDLKAMGDTLHNDHDERYVRTREFIDVVKGVWEASHESGFTFDGKYYQLNQTRSHPLPYQQPRPELYFGGSSPAGKRVAAEQIDVYLMWLEPLEWIREQIAEMEALLDEQEKETGVRRKLRYGIRAQLVVREDEEQAWQDAWAIISKVDPELLQAQAKRHTETDAKNQQRQMELWHNSKDDQFVIGPNLWSGLSAVRGGGAVALVGTPEQVSERLLELVDAGVTSFILSGYPHLEEAEISGRLLMPLLKSKLAQREVMKPTSTNN